MDSCRNCAHAYLRLEQYKDYSYEACALGAYPMVTNLPSDSRCDLWDRMTDEKLKLILPPKKQPFIWGADLILD